MSEFDHLSRRQFPDIDPDGATVFDLCRVSDRLRHEGDHSRLVDSSASTSDMPVDEELIMLQRRASHEVVARLHLIENDLGKKTRGAGDLAMDARDLAGNLALLFSREPALQGRAEISRHRSSSGVYRERKTQATSRDALLPAPSNPISRLRIRRSASAMMRSISSLTLGTSWMRPTTMPQLQAPASMSPSIMTLG